MTTTGEDEETLETLQTGGVMLGMQNDGVLWKMAWGSLKKLKIEPPEYPAIPFLAKYRKELKARP